MTITRPQRNGRPVNNVVFITDDAGEKHCISYDSDVAKIDTDGNYVEFKGENYYSRTSVMHKNLFKKYYNVEER